MRLSVIIATHNRRNDLGTTLAALARLTPPPNEILVCLDGCNDGSAELLRTSYPAVRVLVNDPAAGSIPSRDRLIRTATSELVLSLDDDSHPVEADFIVRAIAQFTAAPRLAVLGFPQRSDEFPASLTQQDFGPDQLTGSYVSSGAIIRKAAYESLAGYAPMFRHAYEEPDFTLQCMAGGWEVRHHTALTIRHHYSGVNRNELRTHHLHARNEQWSILLRCPAPWWIAIALRRAAGQFVYACRRGPYWVVREPLWWWAALRGVSAAWSQRTPVSWSAYRQWLRLLRHPEALA